MTSKTCNAVNQTGERCKKNKIKTSKYCKLHQDPLPWTLFALSFLLSILIALFFYYLQNTKPNISVSCKDVGDPSKIECEVKNKGRAEAKDLNISFTKMMPLDTKIDTPQQYAIALKEVEILPDPTTNPESSEFQKAFNVYIQTIAKKSKFTFKIMTVDEDNKRAAIQLNYLQNKNVQRLTNFWKDKKDLLPKDFDFDNFLNYLVKSQNFYKPEKFYYSEGEFNVNFISEKEKLSYAIFNDYYNNHIKNNQKQKDEYFPTADYLSPIVKFKKEDGEGTYAFMPVFIETKFNYKKILFTEEIIKIIDEKGSINFNLYPEVPDSYDY